MNNIYILVEVTYDYYRFQKNIFCKVNCKNFNEFLFNKKFGVIEYKEDSKIMKDLDKSEEDHYWIQQFSSY